MKSILKKLAVLIAIITCFIVILPASDALALSLEIPNASFENISTSNGKFTIDGWSLGVSSPLYVSKHENSYDGVGIKIKKESNLVSKEVISIEAGNYKAGFYFKSESDVGTVTVSVLLHDSVKSVVDTKQVSVALTQFDWRPITLDFAVSEDIKYVKLQMQAEETGSNAYYVDKAFMVKVNFPELTTMPGASLRLVKNSSGIRFHGKVDKEQYEAFCENYSNASVGMLVALKDNLQGLSDFTAENLKSANKTYIEINAVKWYNESTLEQDGFYGFYCAVANIKQQNIIREFAFRTYAKCVVDGLEYIYYGNYDEETNSRSVYELACKAKENIDEYEEEQQEVIMSYVNSIEN